MTTTGTITGITTTTTIARTASRSYRQEEAAMGISLTPRGMGQGMGAATVVADTGMARVRELCPSGMEGTALGRTLTRMVAV